MINTQRAYEITREWIKRFEEHHRNLETNLPDLPAKIREAQLAAIDGQLSDLREEAAQYERLHPEVVG